MHLADNPLDMGDDQESRDYMTMILGSLYGNQTLNSHVGVGRGGLFGALVGSGAPVGLGFDILTCREVRLDAFLFGEEGVRQIVTMEEQQEDFFLVNLGGALLNCYFLGCVIRNHYMSDKDQIRSLRSMYPRAVRNVPLQSCRKAGCDRKQYEL